MEKNKETTATIGTDELIQALSEITERAAFAVRYLENSEEVPKGLGNSAGILEYDSETETYTLFPSLDVLERAIIKAAKKIVEQEDKIMQARVIRI